MTKKADFKQRVRARMAKTGESYATARDHVLADQPGSAVPAGQMMLAALHVSNGASPDLPGTGLASRVLYWRDSLHEGPVPVAAPEELRRIRASFLVGAQVDDRAEGGGWAHRGIAVRDEAACRGRKLGGRDAAGNGRRCSAGVPSGPCGSQTPTRGPGTAGCPTTA